MNDEDDPRAMSVMDAQAQSDIDGYGDEGAGYDFCKMADELEKRGWVFQPGTER